VWLDLRCPQCGVVLGPVGVAVDHGVAWYAHAIGVAGDPEPEGEVRVAGRKWGKRTAFFAGDGPGDINRLLFVCPRKRRCSWRKVVRYQTLQERALRAARAGVQAFHL
jgi:hypothetical protein